MLFTDAQIRYMKGELGLYFNFSHLTNDSLLEIETAVENRLRASGFDEDYKLTTDGHMCRSILNSLPI